MRVFIVRDKTQTAHKKADCLKDTVSIAVLYHARLDGDKIVGPLTVNAAYNAAGARKTEN